jgi:hypothetical protein
LKAKKNRGRDSSTNWDYNKSNIKPNRNQFNHLRFVEIKDKRNTLHVKGSKTVLAKRI